MFATIKRARIEKRIVAKLQAEKTSFPKRTRSLSAELLNPALASLLVGLKTPVFGLPQ